MNRDPGNVAVIGGTGLLGTALSAALAPRADSVRRLTRQGGDAHLDLTDIEAVRRTLDRERPDLVINAAAVVNLQDCETDPKLAWSTNAEPVSALADWCRSNDAGLIQISTDHFFDGDGSLPHAEDADVSLLNEYARTKHAAEDFALLNPSTLVVRTAFVGSRPSPGKGSFLDWIIESAENRDPITLFEDAYFSPIHVDDLAASIIDAWLFGARGIYNIAGREVVSKAQFVMGICDKLNVNMDKAKFGSVKSLVPVRGDSLGLDVSKFEMRLGKKLPTLARTIEKCLPKSPS